MSVPLNRLYHFIENIACHSYDGSVIIYRFWPNGSKNINDLDLLQTAHDWFTVTSSVSVWCHDQEPLNYDYYADKVYQISSPFANLLRKLGMYESLPNIHYESTIFSKSLLLHSEKRSSNLTKYLQSPAQSHQSQLVSVYYWSHAIIARDWFRYAQHENFNKKVKKCFLIYNRAWTGTREYRLKFTDLLIEHGLIDQCQTSCNALENGLHYRDYEFKNSVWHPSHVLENYANATTADSFASADFFTQDYDSTEIEVVLETLFDDDRLHLTEKSLRPIACRQPFILVATHGSLQYLKEYGFKTFDSVWDESYDTIEDPYERMLAIIRLMRTICDWTPEERAEKKYLINEIVAYNQKYFFSQDFFDLVVNELQKNLSLAFDLVRSDPEFDKWLKRWKPRDQHSDVKQFLDTNQDMILPTRKQYNQILQYISEYNQSCT